MLVEPLWESRLQEGLWSGKEPVPLQAMGSQRARAVLRLEFDEGPIAVGPYCVAVYRWRGQHLERIAVQPFSVIFNAFDPADRAAYHWRAREYLSDEMYIAQKSAEGQPYLYDWHLDIHKDRVFSRAIQAVAGCRDPQTATERVAQVTAAQIEGFWPELGVVPQRDGGRQGADDTLWQPAAVRSISERLRTGARRGQCFDYAALSVALLRSVGLVATATSVMDPQDIEHPRAFGQQVSWSFHVWTEVYTNDRWQAIDVAYLDGILGQRIRWNAYPGLQRVDGPWFARMIGPNSRVYRQRGRQVVDVTGRYQKP